MVNKIFEGMVGTSKGDKEKIIWFLVLCFCVMVFLGGFHTGRIIQHDKENNTLEWYGEHCRCYNYIVEDEPLYQLNYSFGEYFNTYTFP